MTKIADPHPGLDVAVDGPIGPDAVAHRRGTHLVEDRTYRDGRMEEKPISPVVAACGATDDVRSISWGHAHALGATLCTAAACYPHGGGRG